VSDARPRVTVVAATYNRADLVGKMLDAIADQTIEGVEVIVADDGSTDGTRDRLTARGVHLIECTHGGPSQARNAGWREARAPIVAFTDDDCVPDPGWLEALIAPIESGEADIVQGRTLPQDDGVGDRPRWARSMRVEAENGRYQTCNIAYRTSVLEATGGFIDEFRFGGGEDAELAWRARKAGHRTTFAGDAVVRHVVWPWTFAQHLRDRPRWGGLVRLMKLHPEVRALLFARIFYRRGHALVLASLPVLAAMALVAWWLPLASLLVALVVQAAGRSSEPTITARVVGSLQAWIATLYEIVVFARASLRHRTLVL
jgi:glycosyltransferase involved in cell wall biosynthesis